MCYTLSMKSGEYLKDKFDKSGLKAQAVAFRANIKPSSLSRLFSSEYGPSFETLEFLAKILDFTIEDYKEKTGVIPKPLKYVRKKSSPIDINETQHRSV